jgi:hypothetical protein
MASHGIRKLGVITGVFMILFLFIDTLLRVDLYIAMVPTGLASFVKFYAWGYIDGAVAVNMLMVPLTSAPMAWVTTIFTLFAAIMTIAASTPGSVSANSKRLFGIAATFCVAHVLVYVLFISLSTLSALFFMMVGPGFYILLVFAVSNIISAIKVQ